MSKCRIKMLCFCQCVGAVHDLSHLDVWTLGDKDISKRLYLFRFCFYRVSTTEEELSLDALCVTHTESVLSQAYDYEVSPDLVGRHSGGDGARINSDSIVSLEMKLRMCLLFDPECSCIVCSQLGSNGC